MCFNQTTSLVTFSISIVCFFYLIYYGISNKNNYDLFAAVLTILIGSMQLIEYFLWGNQTCSQTNHLFSLLIMALLYLQVILGSIVFIYLFPSKSEQWFSNLIWLSIGFYTLFTFYLLYWLNQKRLCSKPMGGSCRLVWAPFQTLVNDSYGRILFLIFFSLYFFLGSYAFGGFQWITGKSFEGHFKYPLRYSLLSFTFIVAALYAFLTNGKNVVDIFGTTWCFLAVAFGVVSVLHL
jgi:hypothetical protein